MTFRTSAVAVCCWEQFGELPRALLLRFEQPHILDRDHRLVGKGGHQLDLLVGERPHGVFRTSAITPIGYSFTQERDAKGGPKTGFSGTDLQFV